MPIITECATYLQSYADGQWYETYRLKDKATDKYMHPIQRDMLVLRVESKESRAFYWIYNIQDALKFNQYVGLNLKMEAHEIIITPRCRIFYDIDLKLTEYQKNEVAECFNVALTDDNETSAMEVVAQHLADVFKEATLVSLEDHGIDLETELGGFDWMATMRNRPLDNDGYKVSIHIITNIVVPLKACSAIVEHIKADVIKNNPEVLMIDESIIDLLIDAIDVTQYHRNGSLSLPFGTKQCDDGTFTNWIFREYAVAGQQYFITIGDIFMIADLDLTAYNITDASSYGGVAASPEFVQAALKHVSNIQDYSSRVWDISTSILRKSTMYVKRYASSMCSICNRVHDNDNTMFLIFNSERGIASWKCARRPDIKPIVFYKQEIEIDNLDMDDIDAFAKRYDTLNTLSSIDMGEDPLDIAPPHKMRPRFDKTHHNLPVSNFEGTFQPGTEILSSDEEQAPKQKKRTVIKRAGRSLKKKSV